jgi:hypothetical protein
VSGGVQTVEVAPAHIVGKCCPLCNGEHFRRLVRIVAMPKCLSSDSYGLAFVDLMSCRSCSWVMDNPRTPAAIRDHGVLRPCPECGCEVHEECYSIASVSRLVVGAPEDKILMRKASFCARCGKRFEVEPVATGKAEGGSGKAEGN